MSLKQKISRNITNLPGKTIGKKIVVIESDDWGSLRMPSIEISKILESNGLDINSGDSRRYNENDTLENENDLNSLFDVLTSFKDCKGNHPVFTPVSVVANPDFQKIKEGNFEKYYWEPFTETLSRYNRTNTFNLWKEGINKKIFLPEFHGREHLNVAIWMRALQSNDKETHLAFENEFWGYTNKNKYNIMYQAAFDIEAPSDLVVQKEVIATGLDLFEQLFGYKARYFVPPNGPFNNSLEEIAFTKGIDYIFASKIQKEVLGYGQTKSRYYWLGKKNKHGQMYMSRNCFFEPSQAGKDWVASCLKDIERAFRWRKPAVISSHRVNFIGGLNPQNRENGLIDFEKLLKEILIKWPDVEFKSSSELGDLLSGKLKNDK
jgi:hypothetical protein